MPISNSFLDPGSEFGILNDATINALKWKTDKPSNFDIKISIIDKDGKIVTSIGNFTRIDNGEPEPMLCLDNMPISNSFLDPGSEFGILNDATINALKWKTDKPSNFDIKISIIDKDGKIVTSIGNFTRIDNGEPEPMLCLEALNLPKKKQDSSSQVSTISSSLTSEEDLKKNA
ncbi:hypothetical protein Glove_21g6 [Diversispora epigaea]|uniref:Uncharacterized protein n=1 Tax=Diversispora epigaea TaxID=1348612 RepID=A0A397JVA9_9GLOM|nr:hypothetical protein Glove_21g6 [Diversispora epigaea]